MQVILDLSEELIATIIKNHMVGMKSFNEAVFALLVETVVDQDFKELDETQVNECVKDMLNHALKMLDCGEIFKVNELYVNVFEEKWTRLSPSTRKMIGRRFRTYATQDSENAFEGDKVINFVGRNINNAAQYTVTIQD